MASRNLTKIQFLIQQTQDGTVIRAFKRKRQTALFTKNGKMRGLMEPKEFHQLPKDVRDRHDLRTVWTLIPTSESQA